ncbi:serine hydrolase domain-containing protein [Streptomyces sp. NPDC060187]|uniref:serine hydrolase domain-containing protein n=1 Tax=Streptomyces sp. NPDC060187 TaxID=3347067 RepID=UPI003660BB33
MSTLDELLAEGREQHIYSGAAWSVGGPQGPTDRGWTGTRSWDGQPLDGDDLWDLASLTKPVVGIAVMALVERGALGLDDTIGTHLQEYRHSDKADLTVRQLLTHTSGIPGQVPLYRDHPTRAQLLEALRHLPLIAEPDTRVQYSSQGFIILGLIAEAAAGQPLQDLVTQLVCTPLGMRRTLFHPAPEHREQAVATENCSWRRSMIVGQVHDENAAVLREPSGHAGLFSTLGDMELLAIALADEGRGLLTPATTALMTVPHTDALNLRRALAWQGQDEIGSPVGTAFGHRSYGHTGFTGTSLWIDPATQRYAVLLTNRVHPTRDSDKITDLRRAFHDAAAKAAAH